MSSSIEETPRKQPGDALPASFLQELRELEAAYLAQDDPIRQSGFRGGAERWHAERGPILDAVESSEDILDIGCANAYLLECLVAWGRERDLALTPHGLDQGPRLIEIAKRRLPEHASNLHVGNVWDWEPPRRFQYVYTLYDCVPPEYLAEYINRVIQRIVAPGGRLIIGAYGSRSLGTPPFDIAGFVRSMGFTVAGVAYGGSPPVTAFAWIDA